MPHIRGLQSSQPHVIMSFGLLMWEHFSRESGRERQEKKKKKLLSVKPPLVLITASCLCGCRVLQERSQASMHPPPPHLNPDIQASCPGATQRAKAHPLTTVKQQGATGPEGAETVWEKQNNCKETDASTQANTSAQTHTHTHTHSHNVILCESVQLVLSKALRPQTGGVGVRQ